MLMRFLCGGLPATGCLLLALLAGCTNTRTVASWQLPPAQPHPRFQHVYVIALSPQDGAAPALESELLRRLREKGLWASAGRDGFGDARWDDPDGNRRIRQGVRERGADSVLVIDYLDTDQVQYYVPPITTTVATPGPVSGDAPTSIAQHYQVLRQPGYFVTTRAAYLQSSLYALAGDRPVWQAQSALVDPLDARDGLESFTRALVAELLRSGALVPRPPPAPAAGQSGTEPQAEPPSPPPEPPLPSPRSESPALP